MKIEVWSDVVCPFCYIGKRRLERALSDFAHSKEVDVEFKSFQLDSNAEKNTNQNIHEMLANKYGVSYEKGKEMNESMAMQAKEEGLDFHFDQVIPTNTEDAHRLSQYAKQQGKMYKFMERVMKAYFTEGKDVGEHQILADLAEEVGLDKKESLQVLAEGHYKGAVVGDQQLAQQLGVQGVPFFVFNEKYALSGAQPTESFKEVLEKVYEEEQNSPIQVLNPSSKTEYCDGDSCGE
ncbi:disulfide bond formation protein DsbA [Halalkalibacillus sediminis]|uniref:Disulfide bond formation protein DsbA n=1 Tax=Halalkalibacillus sediminis TaxID=2018042 RepID=A0A2I0QSL6_9BACI|nr:DsbA family oxidoreductase [Halalkalibacillus sediminis]PKR77298.1 disulfide bond formation protein DsbA [Halalkalibacillus sediminis]